MDEPIIPRETIRAKARRDFARGAGYHQHGMNPGAAAIAEWQGEWERLNAARAKRSRVHGNQSREVA